MGLDIVLNSTKPAKAKIGGEILDLSMGQRVGSYSSFHNFRLEIVAALENGKWGSIYPTLMDHSDCDGGYTPTQSKRLLKEMEDIIAKFRKIPHAKVNIFFNGKLKTSNYQFGPGYKHKGDEKFYEHYAGCSPDDCFGVIIDEKGMAIFHRGEFLGYFKKIEGVGIVASGVNHKGEKIRFNDIENKDIFDNFFSFWDKGNHSHIGNKEAIFSVGIKFEANRYHLELFRELAKASIKHKAKIIFC